MSMWWLPAAYLVARLQCACSDVAFSGDSGGTCVHTILLSPSCLLEEGVASDMKGELHGWVLAQASTVPGSRHACSLALPCVTNGKLIISFACAFQSDNMKAAC